MNDNSIGYNIISAITQKLNVSAHVDVDGIYSFDMSNWCSKLVRTCRCVLYIKRRVNEGLHTMYIIGMWKFQCRHNVTFQHSVARQSFRFVFVKTVLRTTQFVKNHLKDLSLHVLA
jgi:hypothetical protein